MTAINLAKHDIQRADNGHHIRQHVMPSNLVQRCQMGKPGRLNLAPIRLTGPVRHQIHTELTLWRFHRRVRGPGRYLIPLRKQLKVMDKRLHRLFHLGAGRWRYLPIVRLNLTGRHPIEALVDNAQRLAHLLNAAQIPIVAVALRTNRYIELHLIVRIVRLHLPQVPLNTGTPQHDTTEAIVQRIQGRNDPNVHRPLRPDPPEEGGQRSHVQCVRTDRHDVVEDACNFRKQHTDVLRPRRDLNAEQLFHRERVALLVAHHRDVVEPVEVRQGLHVRLVLDQLLGAAVQQPNVRIRTHDRFAVQLQHQAQHTVGSRMLRSEVDLQIAHLLLDRCNLAVPWRKLPACSYVVRVHYRAFELFDELLVRKPFARRTGWLLLQSVRSGDILQQPTTDYSVDLQG
uniref:Uncharacterized protein n=1 Tax=Anopheles melas TaxID=34690 RepID=A0A182TXL0_9DIPT